MLVLYPWVNTHGYSWDGLAQAVHAAMISTSVKDKLFGHASTDATAIDAREKPVPKPRQELESKVKGKRGRRRKGE
jgi:hypothetical protein